VTGFAAVMSAAYLRADDWYILEEGERGEARGVTI